VDGSCARSLSLPHRGKPTPQPGRSKKTRRCAPEPESSDLPAPAPRFGFLQKVPPLSAAQRFWPSHRLRALQLGPCLVSTSKMAELRSTTTSWKTPFGRPLLEKRTGCSLAMPMPANGQRSAILYTIIESCRCRGIDPYAYLRDVLTRLPSMTNWQVKHVTPEAWAKTSRSSATATVA
jgi:hypothetical protein